MQQTLYSLAYLSILIPLNFLEAQTFATSIWNRNIVSSNLLVAQSPESLRSKQVDLTQKLQSTTLAFEERNSYTFALGLVLRQQKNLSLSSQTFLSIPEASRIWPSVQYYLAENARDLGHAALAQNNFLVASTEYKNAQVFLTRLAEFPEEPAYVYYSRTYLMTKLSIASLNLTQKNTALAKVGYHQLLQSDLMNAPQERAEILKGLATCYLLDKDDNAIRYLSKKYATNFNNAPEFQTVLAVQTSSQNTELKKYKGDLPIITPSVSAADTLFTQAKTLEDFDRLIKAYPLSDAALKASAKIDVLLNDRVTQPISMAELEQFKSLNADSLYKLGQELWNEEKSDQALTLYREFYTRYPFDPRAQNAFFYTARLYEDQLLWRQAREVYREVTLKYENSNYSERSQFKIGFMSYLAGDYAQAVKELENYRAKSKHINQQAEALYWIMMTYEKQNKLKEKDTYQKEISKVAPLSYYAFLTNQIPHVHAQEPMVYPTKLSNPELEVIEKALSFLMAGIPSFAQSYISHIDLENKPELSLLVTQLFYDAKFFARAFSLGFENLSQSSPPWNASLLTMFFPKEFQTDIDAHAKPLALDPALIQSLIKQESAFNPLAKSRVGASGLMQLMPATAEATAKEAKINLMSLEELINPSTNIQIGTFYFSTLLKEFDQKTPLALAAYNCGSKRVTTWRKRWKDRSMSEFVEFIPLDETRNYVKYILRNYVFYKQLRNEKVSAETLFVK